MLVFQLSRYLRTLRARNKSHIIRTRWSYIVQLHKKLNGNIPITILTGGVGIDRLTHPVRAAPQFQRYPFRASVEFQTYALRDGGRLKGMYAVIEARARAGSWRGPRG